MRTLMTAILALSLVLVMVSCTIYDNDVESVEYHYYGTAKADWDGDKAECPLVYSDDHDDDHGDHDDDHDHHEDDDDD